jgi:hypothetical protein
MAMWYTEKKNEHRFDGLANFDVKKAATWDLLLRREKGDDILRAIGLRLSFLYIVSTAAISFLGTMYVHTYTDQTSPKYFRRIISISNSSGIGSRNLSISSRQK